MQIEQHQYTVTTIRPKLGPNVGAPLGTSMFVLAACLVGPVTSCANHGAPGAAPTPAASTAPIAADMPDGATASDADWACGTVGTPCPKEKEGVVCGAEAALHATGFSHIVRCTGGVWTGQEVPPPLQPATGSRATLTVVEGGPGGVLRRGTVVVNAPGGVIACGYARPSVSAPVEGATRLRNCSATFALGTELTIVWSSFDLVADVVAEPGGRLVSCTPLPPAVNTRSCRMRLVADTSLRLVAPSGPEAVADAGTTPAMPDGGQRACANMCPTGRHHNATCGCDP